MLFHKDISDGALRALIRQKAIRFAGWAGRGKIYGLLRCQSGQKMKRENRVFFCDRAEAERAGYRPCARCMPEAYAAWRLRKACASVSKRR